MLNQRKWEREEDWELIVWFGSWSSPTFLHHVFTNISSNCLGMYTATNYIQLTFLHCVFSGENGQREGEDWELSGFGSRRNVPAPIFRRLASPSPSVIHSTMQMAHCTPLWFTAQCKCRGSSLILTHWGLPSMCRAVCASFLRPDLAVVHEDLYIVVC